MEGHARAPDLWLLLRRMPDRYACPGTSSGRIAAARAGGYQWGNSRYGR